ncbi:MAG: hypothetical protein A2506_05025 [Elusimicrobia bacterium RIFOXYD12_FULL_66_9]|nr:MAG: hypothetical protein A2506_05025 [Elusimicrobia bacterium RIFOXYD12_FULL_66_9]
MRSVHPLVPLAFLMAALAAAQAYHLLLLGAYGALYAELHRTNEFRLDTTVPSLFDAVPAELRAPLDGRRVRLALALSPRDALRRAGWAAVGPMGRPLRAGFARLLGRPRARR